MSSGSPLCAFNSVNSKSKHKHFGTPAQSREPPTSHLHNRLSQVGCCLDTQNLDPARIKSHTPTSEHLLLFSS